MAAPKLTSTAVASEIRRILKRDGYLDHAQGVQWFFKEEIKSHGWYTGDLRRAAVQVRREILDEHDLDFLLRVADKLFDGQVLDEKVFAVFLLEKLVDDFGASEFRMFVSGLDRISSWADHDGLVHYLIASMIPASPTRTFFDGRSRRIVGIGGRHVWL
jgi:exoribonuclease R